MKCLRGCINLTKSETKKLPYFFAVNNNKNVKNWGKLEEAGEKRLRGFFQRNNTLSLRKPEATNMSKATSFNRLNVLLSLEPLRMFIILSF